MNRAYSILDIKALDDPQRVITGVATTPATDRMGDIVEPLGAQFKNPMPLLWQHDAQQPIGQVTFGKPTKAGIPFTAQLVDPATVDSPTLKDRLQLAWDSIKAELVRAVSIGFRAMDYELMKDGGLRFKAWECLELSAVTIPANAEATITTIRSVDAEARALAVEQAQSEVSEVAPDQQAEAEAPSRGHVAKLAMPARVRAPLVITRIKHLR